MTRKWTRAVWADGAAVLLERHRELEMLDRLVQDALAGDAVLALLEGPAGIGKSTPLTKAREKATAAGFRVLAARGSDLERDSPRWLTGRVEPAARVFAPLDEHETTRAGSFGVLHGLFWLTANVEADGPLCLSIDNLRW